jgi:hypothetical protein
MAAMISENMYLIPFWIRSDLEVKDRYLLVVTDLESETQSADPMHEKIDSVTDKIIKKLDDMNSEQSDIKD